MVFNYITTVTNSDMHAPELLPNVNDGILTSLNVLYALAQLIYICIYAYIDTYIQIYACLLGMDLYKYIHIHMVLKYIITVANSDIHVPELLPNVNDGILTTLNVLHALAQLIYIYTYYYY